MTTMTKAPPREATVKVAALRDSPLQLRKKYDEAEIDELAQRIKALGFFGRLIVREVEGQVEIVDGHCRKRAAEIVGLAELPVEVRDLTDDEVVAFMLAARGKPLTPLEEGDGLRQLVDAGERVEEVAALVGRPAGFVRQRIALALAPSRVRVELDGGGIGVGHALLIAGLPEDLQDDALDFALDEEATLVELRSWAEARSQDLARAPWDVQDAKLHGGACKKCDTRTGATADLFEGITGDRCLNAVCWDAKLKQAEAGESDIRRALEARGLELRRFGTAGRMNVVDERGGVVIGDQTGMGIRAWLTGQDRSLPPLPPKKKAKGKALPAAEPERPPTKIPPARSQIERMIDEACGVDPDGTLPPPGSKLPPKDGDEYRALELRRRDVFMRVMAKVPGRLGRAELEIVLEHVLGSLSSIEEELILMALRSDTGEIGAIDELSDSDIAVALVAAALAKGTNPYAPEDSLLMVTAQRLGVVEKPTRAVTGARNAAAQKKAKAKKGPAVASSDELLPGEKVDFRDKPKAKKKAPAKKKARRAPAGAAK